MQVRVLAPHEVTLHRTLRLSALRDAPDSFGETLCHAEAQPVSYWEEMTRHVTAPGGEIMVLVCEGDGWHVGGPRVAPPRHRAGAAAGRIHWAREHGLKRLALWAPAHRPAAIALYRGPGFARLVNSGRCRAMPR
jgi:hypothetical protein